MAKSMPSLVALLGLLAVAGYQNRDKLGSVLGEIGNGGNRQPGEPSGTEANAGKGGLNDLLSGVGGMLGGAGAGGLGSVLSGGLGDLMEQFKNNGNGEKAERWVKDGPDENIDADELERTLGADTIAALEEKTGLSKQELLERLSRTLPGAVDRFTPEGRLPTETEASRFV
ncbi:MAG: YidB family protein [Candidatus Devosia phytovorans]|uniref:YidB family protein n=1 Tax=Candidatus Devosia phytovorans TaxID=3121372 RepID=A0AAJ6B1S4_9HYPH|nr:YidB family protein [Devosia sp.]WEK04718.1 MAG: YidB family protein [Devosia sp.]